MDDYIGKYVKAFESGNKGCLSFSQSGNDYGLSCGSYQLTLRWGNCIKFLKEKFPELASELYFNHNLEDTPSSKYLGKDYCSSPDEVSAVWKACYDLIGYRRFHKIEYDYIIEKYYEPLMKHLNGLLNPNDHSRSLQECLFSYAIHKGVSGAYSGLKSIPEYQTFQNMNAEQLINLIYDYRYAQNKFSRYSQVNGSERDALLHIKHLPPLPYTGTNRSTGLSLGICKDNVFICMIRCHTLDIMCGPSSKYDIVGRLIQNIKYPITEVSGNWGRLKSGLGWINLNYVNRVDS